MADPGIGSEVPQGRPPVCLFTGPTPSGPECGRAATVHIAALRWDGELAGLHTCTEHAAVARAVPTYCSEHSHGAWCGFPGSAWDEPGQRCVLDDSGESRSAIGRQAAAHV